MPLNCARCGYENKDNYRFCGMCGGVFPVAQTKSAASNATPSTASSSFPGPQASARSLAYLLEDDEPRSGHTRMYLALALLIISALLLAWHWRRDGYPWSPTSAAQSQGVSATTAAPAATTAQSSTQPTSQPAPGTSTAELLATASPVASKPEPVPVSTDSSPHQPQVLNTPPETAENQELESQKPQSGDSTTSTSAAALEPTSEPKEKAAKKTSPKPSPAAALVSAKDSSGKAPAIGADTRESVSPEPAVPVKVDPEDKLVADGEKYLYGNGVPQDCDRATRNLKVAASRANPKAQSLLGSMYASGNCVPRDLPTAYRWFAQSLHNDPSNTRIERDLELIWQQLTPGERQIALHNGP